jgi:hypothetical protein
MLTSLQNYDRQEAANVIAALALSSAPNPNDELPDLVKRYEPLLKPLETEIKQRLRLSINDTSSTANSRYHNEVAKLLAQTLLGDKDQAAILARAGKLGRLSPSQYKVNTSTLYPEFREMGVRPSHIMDAITNADDVQHLNVNGAEDEKLFSLFMRIVRSRRPSDLFWLLVCSQRAGITQLVQHAWRIYVEDVTLYGAKTPLDVLRMFTSTFGLRVSVGTVRGKLIVDEVVDTPVGEATKLLEIHLDYPNQRTIHTFSTVALSSPPRHHIKIAYAINLRKYVQCLVAHNVDVSRPMLQSVGLMPQR